MSIATIPGQSATAEQQSMMDRMHEAAFSFGDDVSVIVEGNERTGWITVTIL